MCVFAETRSLEVFGPADQAPDAGRSDGVRNRFGQWMLSGGDDYGAAEIRFLWIPESPKGARLEVHSTRRPHALVQVRSQDRDSIVAVSAASDPLTMAGWLFSINFRLEQVLAALVRSNGAGMQSQALRLSCSFEDKTPEVSPPASDNDIG